MKATCSAYGLQKRADQRPQIFPAVNNSHCFSVVMVGLRAFLTGAQRILFSSFDNVLTALLDKHAEMHHACGRESREENEQPPCHLICQQRSVVRTHWSVSLFDDIIASSQLVALSLSHIPILPKIKRTGSTSTLVTSSLSTAKTSGTISLPKMSFKQLTQSNKRWVPFSRRIATAWIPIAWTSMHIRNLHVEQPRRKCRWRRWPKKPLL